MVFEAELEKAIRLPSGSLALRAFGALSCCEVQPTWDLHMVRKKERPEELSCSSPSCLSLPKPTFRSLNKEA